MITSPTRSQGRSKTLIDNIFTSNYSSIKETGIILSDISDHYPMYVIMQNKIKEKCNILPQRQMTKKNLSCFIDRIKIPFGTLLPM